MLATWNRFEEFNFNFALNVILAQVGCANLNLIPAESTTLWSLDLRLVDRGELTGGNVSVKDEEREAVLRQSGDRVEADNFRIGSGFDFLGSDDDLAGPSCLLLWIQQSLG